MSNWDEIDYNQISSDWRHRDNLTWQVPSVIVIVGGALIAAAFGLNIAPEWSGTLRALLLGFGAFFSLILSISLAQNLWYQVGSEEALRKFLNGGGSDIPKVRRRTLSPKDFGVSKCDFIKRVFSGLMGSTLLLIFCFVVAGFLFWLFGTVIYLSLIY